MKDPVRMETRMDQLWSDFVEARNKAEQSKAQSDGIAAGRAWSRWLSEFCPDDATRKAVHGNVVSMPR